jgi:hypothetical protein
MPVSLTHRLPRAMKELNHEKVTAKIAIESENFSGFSQIGAPRRTLSSSSTSGTKTTDNPAATTASQKSGFMFVSRDLLKRSLGRMSTLLIPDVYNLHIVSNMFMLST